MQFSKVKQGQQTYFLSANIDKDTENFLKAFHLRRLPNVATNDLIIKYLQNL
jgi:hypothetical protein